MIYIYTNNIHEVRIYFKNSNQITSNLIIKMIHLKNLTHMPFIYTQQFMT